MVRMGNHPRPLNTVVHLLYHLQQTRIHRNGINVVDRQLHQHGEMEKELMKKTILILLGITIPALLAVPALMVLSVSAGGVTNSTTAAPTTVLQPEPVTTTTTIDLSFLNTTTTSTTMYVPPTVPEYRNTEIQTSTSDTWDQLAQCETGGNWSANTGNGYGGGLQFAHMSSWSTWKAFGGQEFSTHPWEASREQQIIVAERVLTTSGWKAWPGCSRKLGLR